MKKFIVFLLIYAFLACAGVLAADTSAIYAYNTSVFYKGGILSVDQPDIKTENIYGLKLFPVNETITSSDREVFFPHYIENLGNTTNTVSLEIVYVSRAKGWSAELVNDPNGNGRMDWGEGALAESPIRLGEGGTYHFFLKLTRPDNLSPGDSGSAKIKATCLGNDGSDYTGYNGLTYGGPDEVESTDTVIIK